MIEGDRVLAVIAARGGSKGLPGKNVRLFFGKPLIAWSIEAGKNARLIDRLIVSTDDEKIAETARQWGADIPFLRPSELATDESPIEDTLIHALDTLNEDFRFVVLLQATSPLRTGEDIDACLQECIGRNAPSAVSVCTAPKSPYLSYRIRATDRRLEPILSPPRNASRRQDLPETFVLNGAVYAARVSWLRRSGRLVDEETVASIMPDYRSADIDTMLDFVIAESIYSYYSKINM